MKQKPRYLKDLKDKRRKVYTDLPQPAMRFQEKRYGTYSGILRQPAWEALFKDTSDANIKMKIMNNIMMFSDILDGVPLDREYNIMNNEWECRLNITVVKDL